MLKFHGNLFTTSELLKVFPPLLSNDKDINEVVITIFNEFCFISPYFSKRKAIKDCPFRGYIFLSINLIGSPLTAINILVQNNIPYEDSKKFFDSYTAVTIFSNMELRACQDFDTFVSSPGACPLLLDYLKNNPFC